MGIDMMSTDEVKEMLGIPAAVNFTELEAALPRNFGANVVKDFDTEAVFADFMETRRMRLRDVMQRDALELKILAEKKKALAAAAAGGNEAGAGEAATKAE